MLYMLIRILVHALLMLIFSFDTCSFPLLCVPHVRLFPPQLFPAYIFKSVAENAGVVVVSIAFSHSACAKRGPYATDMRVLFRCCWFMHTLTCSCYRRHKHCNLQSSTRISNLCCLRPIYSFLFGLHCLIAVVMFRS